MKTTFMIKAISVEIKKYLPYLKNIIQQGGPEVTDYETFNSTMREIGELYQQQVLSDNDMNMLRAEFGEVLSTPQTIYGFASVQPHGYAGDFEIIDKIYTQHISENPLFSKWDRICQNHASCKAVRNRKDYFKQLLKSKPRGIRVLNLASGPCRDIAEYLQESGDTEIQFDCIELDETAINYAKKMFKEHGVNESQVNFINQNIFRFKTEKKYDLVWSAGLFDYFDDKIFEKIINRFLNNVAPGGEFVVGNFADTNPTKAVMDFILWILHHRSEQELINLAMNAGVKNKEDVSVHSESEGVNLFLTIKGF